MPVLREPLPLDQSRLLRSAVLAAARSDGRRRVPSRVCVGVPGAWATTVLDEPSWDHGLRSEIVGSALRAHRDPGWVWVTRSGPLSLQDVDVAWLGPALSAAAERAVDIAYVVVTRHGWLDPRSGVGRRWKRIRSR